MNVKIFLSEIKPLLILNLCYQSRLFYFIIKFCSSVFTPLEVRGKKKWFLLSNPSLKARFEFYSEVTCLQRSRKG